MPHSKVIIIGAGAAGIAAASRLIANGIADIIILEAQDRVGGRIHSSRLGDVTLDLGAQWVHGEINNVCFELGSSKELLTSNFYDLRKSSHYFSDGTLLEEGISQFLTGISNQILHDSENLSISNMSLGDYFMKSVVEHLKLGKANIDENIVQSYIAWCEKFQNSIDGADSWFETSAKGTLEYHECKGNTLTTWKHGGYSKILELLMGKYEADVRRALVLGTPANKITWDRRPVCVTCENGVTYSADHVLVTVSIGVLKEFAASLFSPALPPKKLQAIKDIGTGTVNKIFLMFPSRWWPEECHGFHFLWKNGDKTKQMFEPSISWLEEVFGFYSVDSSPLVLCGWVVGAPARLMEICSDEQVLNGCHKLLVKFLGSHFNIPLPTALIRSKWHSNRYIQASYSFRTTASDNSSATAEDLSTPLSLPSGLPVVLFGGEATHKHLYSTVHGAIETGWREADRIISINTQSSSFRLPKSSL